MPNTNNQSYEELIDQMSPKLKEVYDNVAEPYIAIDVAIAEQELSLLTSKYGGVPFIPENEDCLRDENGYPYLLFAQFNFAEIAEQAGQHPDLPTQGLLQIFLPIFDIELVHNNKLDTSKCVRFYAEIPQKPVNQIVINEIRECWQEVTSLWDENSNDYAKLVREKCEIFEKKYPKSSCSLPIFYREYSLTFSQKICRPYVYDIFFYDTSTSPANYFFQSEQEIKLYVKASDNNTMGDKLLGFGSFCQEDPRIIFNFPNKPEHIYLDNFQLFFQTHGMYYGEYHFFIDKDDLKNQNFSNMMFNFATT